MLVRPKILSVVTVPTGGWAMPIQITTTVAYDVTVVATVPAGDYFVAFDRQSDDFCKAVTDAFTAAVRSGADTDFDAAVLACIIDPSTNKIKIACIDAGVSVFQNATKRAIKLRWTQTNGPSIAAVLGFDSAADDASPSTNDPVFTSDWQHAYGWYSDEDGQLDFDTAEDHAEANVEQAQHPSGYVNTQILATRYLSRLSLTQITRQRMFSAGVAYAATSSWAKNSAVGYEINEPLECWWLRAVQGYRFRVYRDGYALNARAVEHSTATGGTVTTITDASRAWSTDPKRWVGRLVLNVDWGGSANADTIANYMRSMISSNTATVLTFGTMTYYAPGENGNGQYYIFEHPYQTYVLDLNGDAKLFAPREIPNIDRYAYDIPLIRYVAA